MTDLKGMNIFVAVAEAGSLTGAAKALDMPKSTLSRQLKFYETAVGTTLFRRSTRSISLTDAGKEHFQRVQSLVHEASKAVIELADRTQHPTGLIRISATLGIGQHYLAPMVWKFISDYPNVRIEMVLTDEVVDLVADGIDFAIQMGDLQDSELLAKSIGNAKRMIVVSPDCLNDFQRPLKPADLRGIPAIVTTPARSLWRFADGEVVRVNWRIAAGTLPVALDACLLGHGVALLPEKYVTQHVKSGGLIQVLESFPLPEVSINIVYPRLKHQSAAARAFLAELRKITIR